MKRRELEMALQRVPPPPHPDPRLEQVPTPAPLAAHVLFEALAIGDLADRRVLDLGCGTGILAIGASLLGAREVTGLDVDPDSVAVARRTAEELGATVAFEVGDVSTLRGRFDTVLQNPPFGAQRRGADRPFLHAALAAAPVVYTFHLEETVAFVERFAAERGARISHRWHADFPIPRLFRHHVAAVREVDVAVLRLVKTGANGT